MPKSFPSLPSLAPTLLSAVLATAQGGPALEDERLAPTAEAFAAYFEARAEGRDLGVHRSGLELALELLDLQLSVAAPEEAAGDPDAALPGASAPLAATAELGRALWLARGARAPARPGKVVEEVFREGSFAEAGLEFAYRTPKGELPEGAGWPLILALPDDGEGPAEHLRARWTSPGVRDGAVVLCPAMPPERSDWTQVMVRGRPGGLSHIVTAARIAGERFPIDFDRVYVVGHGRSVPAAVAAGNYSPQSFAGIAGRAGDVGEQAPDNFGNLPTFFTGAGPEATRFEAAAREVPGAHCTLQQDGTEEDIWSWMGEHARVPFPAEVHLTVGQPFPTRISWLRVSPSDPEARASGVIDRASNSVRIEGSGISHATLYLNDALLDLDRPVRIVCNGVERALPVQRRLSTLLDLVWDGTSDPGCVYVAQVVCDLRAEGAAESAPGPRLPDAQFETRLAGTGKSAGDLLGLRAWCLESDRPARAAEVLRRVLRLFPEDAAAHEAAGHVLHEERWFTSQARLDRYLASQDPVRAEARGLVRHKQSWMHREDKARASKGWQRDPNTGLWRTPDDRRRLDKGWLRQDLEWIEPTEAAQVDAGLWKVDGEWLDLAQADARHARLDSMWHLPSPEVLLHTTVRRATAEQALEHMARALDDLRRVFGVEPPLPLEVALLASEEQVDRFALGEPDGRRWPTHAGRTHVFQGAFFAERWFERVEGELEFRGMGVGFWDALVPYGDSYGVHSARLATGLSYVEALDPSPKAVRSALKQGPGLEFDEAWAKEKQLPDWLRWGAAVYAERCFRDDAVAEGNDPWWARKWSIENLTARGGARPLEEIFAFELDPDAREDGQKLLLEAGLVVAFVLDGECAPVQEAHADFKRALLSGRLHVKDLTALEEALLAQRAEFRAFAE